MTFIALTSYYTPTYPHPPSLPADRPFSHAQMAFITRIGPHQGSFMFHCHNLQHEDEGLMGQYNSTSATSPRISTTFWKGTLSADRFANGFGNTPDSPRLLEVSAHERHQSGCSLLFIQRVAKQHRCCQSVCLLIVSLSASSQSDPHPPSPLPAPLPSPPIC